MSDEARMDEPEPTRRTAGEDPGQKDRRQESERRRLESERRRRDPDDGGNHDDDGPEQPFQMPGADFLEPHESLKYVGKLFKGLGVAVFLLMSVEIILGLTQDGFAALPILLLEVAQLLIFAGLLWGFGDLAYLVVETNHDVRASRVHLWQMNMMRQMELQKGGVQVEAIDTEEEFR